MSRIITRRDSLRLLGLSGAVSFAPAFILPSAAQAAGTCTLTPELTHGPYYIDREKIRENIVEDQPGIPLKMRLTVMDSQRCKPLPGVAVDVWHCDSRGLYSGYNSVDPDVDIGPPMYQGKMGVWPPPTDQKTYLRGVQITNQRGVVEFTSIYPGWYYGRSTHVHVRVHVHSSIEGDHLIGGTLCHTGQLCFPDEMNDRVAATASYTGRKLVRTRNNEDYIFDDHSLTMGMLKLHEAKRDLDGGLIGEAVLTVDPTATPPEKRPSRQRAPA